MNPVWLSFLGAQGASIDAAGCATFGTDAASVAAAATGTVLTDLSHLGLLEIDGEEAASFLQGQLTNDIRLLDGRQAQYAGYCTAKGRLLACLLVFAHEGRFYLQLNGALTEPILKRLRMYVLRAKVTLSNASDRMIRLGLAGVSAEGALKALWGSVPQSPMELLALPQAHIVRLPGASPRFEIFLAQDAAEAAWIALAQQATPANAAAWEALEIAAGIPDITPATQETFVPQMLNLDLVGGISFNKGCYTGQEIVARTHYLGKVKRRTWRAHIAGPNAPQPGDPITTPDTHEPAGQIVRTAPAAQGGFEVLAELRAEYVEATLWWSEAKIPLTLNAPQAYEIS